MLFRSSGHRVELAGEKAGGMAARTVKRGIRSHKLKPYRAAAAAERKAVKANADFLYQKALHDNPALAHSNPISRFWQKQRIKKQYAKTLKAGGKAQKKMCKRDRFRRSAGGYPQADQNQERARF